MAQTASDASLPDKPPLDDPAAMTFYITRRYHDRHREQLEMLAELAEAVEKVHAAHADVPKGLSELMKRVRGDVEMHMRKEELMVFPKIRNGGSPALAALLLTMRAEHDEQDDEAAEIRRVTGNLTLPADACGTWKMLYEKMDEFLVDLKEHLRLENDVLFPQFESEGEADV